ncbi:MAG: lytic transglycosylase domain-containing protein [Bryobacteraceae bacterium]
MSRALGVIFLYSYILAGQDVADFQTKVRAAMAASLEKQKASAQKQSVAAQVVASDPGPSSAFFTVPWPAPVNMNIGLASGVDCDPMPKDQLDSLVSAAGGKAGVQADLIQAVIHKESGAKPCAVSVKGAQGLMQLMPGTADELGVRDPFDPKQNIEAGTKLLKQLLTKYNGDLALTLGAYNAGPGRVDKDGGVPAIPETVNYVSDILKAVSPW